MTCAGGQHADGQGAAGGSLDVAGSPALTVLPGSVPAGSTGPSRPAAPPAPQHAGGAACPSCGSQIDALALASSGMRLIVAALACRSCGWGMTRADLRHLKPLPEDAE